MGAYQSYVSSLSPQPVTWFKFDELGTSTSVIADSGTSNNPLSAATTGTTGTARKSTGGKDTGYLDMLADNQISLTDATSIIPAYLNYTLSFWIKRQVSGGTYAGNSPFGWSGASSTYRVQSGSTASIEDDGKLYWYTVHGGTSHTDLITGDLRTGQWIHIAYVRSGATVKLYQNGSLLQTETNAGTSSSAGLTGTYTFRGSGFGGTSLDEWLLFDYAMTDAQIASLYTFTPASTNKTITDIPGTATALMVQPTLSISRTITETPATATALIQQPTIIIVTPDTTQITTSFLASVAIPQNIIAGADKNVNNVITEVLTASVTIGDNITVVAGTNVSFSATEMTATALLAQARVSEVPMTASSTMPGGTASVTPNYYSLVKALNPYLYITNGLSSPVNHGYQTGTFTKGTALSTNVVSPFPLDMIAEGKSWKGSSGSGANSYFEFTTATAAQSFDALVSDGNFAYEVWVNPNQLPTDPYAGTTPASFSLLKDNSLSINLLQGTRNRNNPPTGDYARIEVILKNSSTTTTSLYCNINSTSLSVGNWSHVVVNVYQSGINANQRLVQLWIDGTVVINQTVTFTTWTASTLTDTVMGSDAASLTYLADSYFDELAIYSSELTNSQIINHYQFIDTLSPNFIYNSTAFTVDIQSGDHNYLVTSNSNITDAPITASALIVNPTVIASRVINVSATPLTASATGTSAIVYWG